MAFPSNPTDNQTYQTGNKTYQYNLAKQRWELVNALQDVVDLSNYVTSDDIPVATTEYAGVNDLPLTGNDVGAQAFVSDTNRLYIWNGSGWYNIALINTAPSITGGGAGAYELAIDGTPTVITLTAEDPEGLPITWSYAVTSGSLGTTATVEQADNVFTITPSTDLANEGEFSITFTASDGVNIATDVNSFTLAFLSPLWNETVLSIGTSSTNSLNNSTFIDRSTNAHTVTASGSPVQTAFHPYLDNWSFYTNRTSSNNGGHLRSDYSSALGTDDFSIECWMYYIAGASAAWTGNRSDTSGGFGSRISGTSITIGNASGGQYNQVMASSTIPDMTNRWAHIVICRSSGTTSIFVDGTRYGTSTSTFNWSLDNAWSVAFEYDNYTTSTLEAYISDYRLVVGSSAYDATQASITVPTEKLTAITNTKILTARSNRFIDESGDDVTFSIQNAPQISAFNPFGQESEYAVGENKGSVNLDADDEFLYTAGSTDYDFDGQFCYEAWFYPTAPASTYGNRIMGTYQYNVYNGDRGFYFATYRSLAPAGTLCSGFTSSGGSVFNFTGITNPPQHTWNHFAVCRDSNNVISCFLNGVRVGTTTNTGTIGSSNLSHKIGIESVSNDTDFQGYISDVRIIKGATPYDPTQTTMTVPTAPVGLTPETVLYQPFDNAGIFDKTGNNTLTLVGSVATSTTQTKFANTAMSFNGNNNYIIQTNNLSSYKLGTGTFTIECWFYLNTLSSDQVLVDMRPASTQGVYPCLFFDAASSKVKWFVSGLVQIESTAISAEAWHHITVCRDGSSTKMFLNGTQVGSTYSDTNNYLCSQFVIGVGSHTLGASGFYGYLENFQILRGVAKYTANFTSPTREQGISYQAES